MADFIQDTGFLNFTWQGGVMIAIACLLLYLAIVKKFEPLLLLPIAFGMLLVNLPLSGIMAPEVHNADGTTEAGGVIYYLYQGVKLGIYPPLIFMGVGAMTDFGPLIANPKSLLLGAAAQLGIFMAFILALLLGFDSNVAASIGIIGGADGPTAIYVDVPPRARIFRADCGGGIHIHGIGANHPAAHYEGDDYKKRTHDQDGSASRGFKDGKNYFPDRGDHLCFIYASGGNSADRDAYAW